MFAVAALCSGLLAFLPVDVPADEDVRAYQHSGSGRGPRCRCARSAGVVV